MKNRRSAPAEPADREPLVVPTIVDEMGEASFPASDPPATWTWDVPEAPAVTLARDHAADA